MTELAAARHTVVPIRGIDVTVTICGDSGLPVVLLPGGGVRCSGYFPELVEALAGHTVVVHDRLGTGSSRTSEPVSVRSWSVDTITLLDALDIDRAVLVGHSLGGAVAMQLLIDHPGRVAAALLLDPTALNSARDCATAARLAPILAAPTRLPVAGPALESLLARLLRPRGMTASGRRAFEETFTGSWLSDTAAVTTLLAEDARAFEGRVVRPARVPVLLAAADRKTGHRVRAAHERFATALGARFETWPGTGHSLHLQRPDLVVDRINSLLAQATG